MKRILLTSSMVLAVIITTGYVFKKTPWADHLGHLHSGAKTSDLSKLTLHRLDGSSVKLGELHAKLKILNFWATWCGPCVQEMPSLVRLSDRFESRGLLVVGISQDESPKRDLPQFLERYAIRFPNFLDPDGELSDQFHVQVLPTTIFLNDKNKIILSKNGQIDWDSGTWSQKVDELLRMDNL